MYSKTLQLGVNDTVADIRRIKPMYVTMYMQIL